MKGHFWIVCAALLGVLACGSSPAHGGDSWAQEGGTLQGEWLIVEVHGQPVPGEAWGELEAQPWVGFDVPSGRVWGSSGCNRLLGSVAIDEPTGTLDLGSGMGTTKMLCANMRLEDAVLAAFARAKRFAAQEDGRIALLDEEDTIVMRLKKKP